ncbi:MAG: NADH-quinone oxidoreductase subunit NuoF [Clostridia bacterium]|nr:NADH-quinone oxidoreductase subunit NuoF [Clostridia bacterium]MDD4386772.1 NADH-quinone oxidoreductase subunit NuoF [Clostridia bacterium]
MFEKTRIMICCGTGCTSSKSDKILEELQKKSKELGANVIVEKTGCFGFCAKGPIIVIEPDQTFYEMVNIEDSEEIIKAVMNGTKVERLMPEEDDKFIQKWHELNFYKKQKRLALRNCGYINPEDIDEYIAVDGYLALEKVLTGMSSDKVINEVIKSGIRGRGGAGFPTGKKWQFTSSAQNDIKYVCCNADEGDPGAFMDRSILEGDPHSVIEAMAIAGFAIGSNQGYIYVRAEYPIAVQRLNIAIKQATEYGLLGTNILSTNFDFNIELRLGAGAFVCGEETALMNSIEGKRGEPRPRPPFPAFKGLFGKPTLLNNVETYANICQIILNGGDWYAKVGTESSKGTKVFALGGNINNVGLVEVPMGTTLREIVFDIGGGIPEGKNFKAAQTGGPSGGCIPTEHLDIPIDYESLTSIGSMMGSGGLIVMDDSKCMVNIAKFFLEFTVDESCGKCPTCRIGTKRMLEILTRITEGKGKIEDIERLEKLSKVMKSASLCGLGQTASNPVMSTLRYFREEYIDHIENKRCATGQCKTLTKVLIDPEKCKQCGICQKNCPYNAIKGEVRKGPFEIDQSKCVKCKVCITKCPFKAINN